MTSLSSAPSCPAHAPSKAVEPAAPTDDLPHVTAPEDYAHFPGRFLAECYERHGPIFAIDWPQHKVVYMVGPDANRFVLHTGRDAFSHDLGWSPVVGRVLGKGLLNMDGGEHAFHRRLMNPMFAASYMTHYLPIMQRVIMHRTRDWAEREEVELCEEARKITFDVAAEALVGFATGPAVDHYRRLFARLLRANPNAITAQMLLDALGVKTVLTPLLSRRIRARRGAPTNDLLGLLANLRDENGRLLSVTQVLGHLNILLVAGHETLTSLIAWLLYSLASHPDHLARVRDEVRGQPGPTTPESLKAMKHLGNAVKEVERLYPPVSNLPRGVVKPFDFGGYAIEPGQRVLLSISGSHALPHIWHDPERFDPDRFSPPRDEEKNHPYALIGFGAGPRVCIGQNLATLELRAVAASVFERFDLEVVEGQEIVQEYKGPGSPKNGIRVRVSSGSAA